MKNAIEKVLEENFGGEVLGEHDPRMPTLELEPLMRGALDAMVEGRFDEYIDEQADEIPKAQPQMLEEILQGAIQDFAVSWAISMVLENWAAARFPDKYEGMYEQMADKDDGDGQ